MRKFTFTKRALIPMLVMPLMYVALFVAVLAIGSALEDRVLLLDTILILMAILQMVLFAPYVVFCEFAAIWYAVKALKNGEQKLWIAIIIILAIILAVTSTLFWLRYWYVAMGI